LRQVALIDGWRASADAVCPSSRLVGQSGTTVTELIYRHQIRPVIQTGGTVMNWIFAARNPDGALIQLAHVPLSGRPFWAENGAVVVW
jgi:hypothetical protein